MNTENMSGPDLDKTVMGARARTEHGDLQVGDVVLQRYTLEEKLGTGAMGVVFKCRDQVSGGYYALKMVPPELARDENAMENIRQNFLLVHNLKHPNIAGTDFLERDEYGAYFLVMEFAPGISLAQWIREKWSGKGAAVSEVTPIVKQIASALDYAHGEKVLHRDVKPANVMIDENGKVKVLDFGLASKVRSSQTSLSINVSNSSGTPNYMPPEQFKAQYPRPASDQYALAAMTYEMLAGHLPFEADNFEVLRAAVLNEEPEQPDEISDPVWAALKKALSKNAKDRFENCTAFAEALSGASETPKQTAPKPAPANIPQSDLRWTGCTDFAEKPKPQPPPAEKKPPEFSRTEGVSTPDRIEKTADEKKKKGGWIGIAVLFILAAGVGIVFGLSQDHERERRVEERRQGENPETPESLSRKGGEYYDRKEYKQAVDCFRKAAEQGHAAAQNWLGYCYYQGYGVAKDYPEAVKWYRKAVEQGNAAAQNNLGLCYQYGNGVDKNYPEAVKWYSKAAEQGYADAQKKLENLQLQ